MIVTVYLAAALLCIGDVCHPALVGSNTPLGEFELNQRLVSDPLYKGSVIQFKEEDTYLFAIHRPWLGRPKEKRLVRLKSSDARDRQITAGCINVEDKIYEQLLESLPSTLRVLP